MEVTKWVLKRILHLLIIISVLHGTELFCKMLKKVNFMFIYLLEFKELKKNKTHFYIVQQDSERITQL